ncbi:SDR family oxidoreductase [Micromonospora sp. NBC_01655]|uniref:SDR family NAD(P)-dependent oxidoreductase n=1 Tax=Micromonospora sp. NBC_01655 TaxID=2975983 RepID=UPI00225A9AC1|nr:SDR family oxidoreductase [Micromonospora sp. NBC_01655]MCX4471339.1 SDR family oxidoreductase [Micromonospora sp. NBC_01655]
MELDLSGNVALVTGASRGIGLAAVCALQREGATVAAVARAASPDLEATGATIVCADLASPDGADEVIAAVERAHGRLDLLVNNVGGGARLSLAPFGQLEDADWQDAWETNAMSTIRATRTALPLLARHGGAIVNVSSIGARKPDGPPLAYNVAKAALTAFSGAAAELAASGIRINTVSPGPTRTAMWESETGLGGKLAAALGAPIEAIVAGTPEQVTMVTGRLSEPEEVADLICFLLSDRAANITGADYLIDGGAIRTV